MDVELGPEHDKLIEELYALRDQIRMSRDERLIVEMAIQMVEYLDGYAADISMSDYMALSPEEQKAAEERAEAAKRASRITLDVDDFERLICSGGFELSDGRLVPR